MGCVSVPHIRGLLGASSAVALCLSLAACGTVDPNDPNRATANPGAGTKLLLGNANPGPLTAPVDNSLNRDCPPIEVLEGTSSYRVYDGQQNDPFSLRWQATLAETARECSSLGAEAVVKVGVVGRVIIGPKGSGGVVRAPLRIAVVDESEKPLYSQVHMVDVSVPAGQSSATFTRVEENIVVPIPANRFRGWRILVGYDPKGAPAEPKTARRRG